MSQKEILSYREDDQHTVPPTHKKLKQQRNTNYNLEHFSTNVTQQHIIQAFDSIYQNILSSGFTISKHILDNEAPASFRSYLRESNITFQLVPPYVHRTNAEERAIQTFKNHFISGLCSTPDNFFR